MSIVINLYTVCKALFGISIPQGPKQKIVLRQLLDSTQQLELLVYDLQVQVVNGDHWEVSFLGAPGYLLGIALTFLLAKEKDRLKIENCGLKLDVVGLP